ncbi:MAG: hypothetical protein ABR508_02050 [Candidatus Baltobacteraceae bacterium]
MTTLEQPLFHVTGTVVFSLTSKRRLRACLAGAPPAYRVLKGVRIRDGHRGLKNFALAGALRIRLQLPRSTSSWSRR